MNLVKKLDTAVSPETFAITPFKPPKTDSPFVFELNVTALPTGRMQKAAQVQPNAPSWSNFEINCDEGKAIGGKDEAPSPLSYFTSGIAFCLLTHLEEFIHAKKLDVQRVQLELKMGFSTTLAVDASAEIQNGFSTGIDVNVVIDSNEDDQTVSDLINLTKNSCIALQSIVQAVPATVNYIHNGG